MPRREAAIPTPEAQGDAIAKSISGRKLNRTEMAMVQRYDDEVIAKAMLGMPRKIFAALCGTDSRTLPHRLRRAGLDTVTGETIRPGRVIGEALDLLEQHAEAAKKAKPIELADSTTDLADAVGATRKRVNEWQQLDAWPFGDTGPYPIAAVRRWAEIQREQAETSDKLGEVELAIKQEDLRKRRLVNAELAGRTVDREAARSKMLGLMRAWGAALLAMCGPMARQFQARGLIDDEQISEAEMVVETAVREICQSFADAGESILEGAES